MTNKEIYEQERALNLPRRLVYNQERAAALEARRLSGNRVMEQCDRCDLFKYDTVTGPCFCCDPVDEAAYCDTCYQEQLTHFNLLPEPRKYED